MADRTLSLVPRRLTVLLENRRAPRWPNLHPKEALTMPSLRASRPSLPSVALVVVSALGFTMPLVAGCGDPADVYKPAPVFSGRKADIPAVPTLPSTPMKVGDAYTIYGAIHQLRSRYHADDVTKKDIVIQGYIVDTNVATAPACAVHKIGKKDPDDCKSEIPSFWIADNKGDKAGQKIRVLGWASNFANVSEAMDKYKNLKESPKHAEKPDNAGKPGYLVQDEVWNSDIPYPIPGVGERVKVTGHYGNVSSKASSGLVTDPEHGVITYGSLEVLEPPTEPAAFSKAAQAGRK